MSWVSVMRGEAGRRGSRKEGKQEGGEKCKKFFVRVHAALGSIR